MDDRSRTNKEPRPGTPRSSLVVVVEDLLPLRSLVVEALQELGCATEDYADAMDLVRRIEEGGIPDLLIMDARLPGIGGLEVLGLLQRRGLRVPTLLMTAFPSQDLKDRAARLGVARVIEKPFDQGEFLSTVQAILHHP